MNGAKLNCSVPQKDCNVGLSFHDKCNVVGVAKFNWINCLFVGKNGLGAKHRRATGTYKGL